MPRINFCAAFGILLSIASVILVIFGYIGQINNSTIPRRIRLISISTSGLGESLQNVLPDAAGTAVNNAIFNQGTGYSDGIQSGSGLRRRYDWGVYRYCASNIDELGAERSYCSPRGLVQAFAPATVLLQDAPTQAQGPLEQALPDNVFTSNDYLRRFTRAANWLFFAGAILCGIAMLVGLLANRFAFLFGSIVALLAFLTLAVGCVIWTVIINRIISALNDATVGGVPLGIQADYGNGLWIFWGACGAALLAVLPYLIACCTGRRDRKEVY